LGQQIPKELSFSWSLRDITVQRISQKVFNHNIMQAFCACHTTIVSLYSFPQKASSYHLKERPVPRGTTYFTDASVLTPAFGNPPTVIIGPGESSMAHKTDEFCYISKIEAATEAYLEIAKKWCKL
jgi:hypothetical protein